MRASNLDESLMLDVDAARGRVASQRRVLKREVANLVKMRSEGIALHY